MSGSLRSRRRSSRLRENEELEKAKTKDRSAAGRKDLSEQLMHAEMASKLEGEETDRKSESAGQEIAEELPMPISFFDHKGDLPIQPEPNGNGGGERNNEGDRRRHHQTEDSKGGPIKQCDPAANAKKP